VQLDEIWAFLLSTVLRKKPPPSAGISQTFVYNTPLWQLAIFYSKIDQLREL
jgi:hypothetical protein